MCSPVVMTLIPTAMTATLYPSSTALQQHGDMAPSIFPLTWLTAFQFLVLPAKEQLESINNSAKSLFLMAYINTTWETSRQLTRVLNSTYFYTELLFNPFKSRAVFCSVLLTREKSRAQPWPTRFLISLPTHQQSPAATENGNWIQEHTRFQMMVLQLTWA